MNPINCLKCYLLANAPASGGINCPVECRARQAALAADAEAPREEERGVSRAERTALLEPPPYERVEA